MVPELADRRAALLPRVRDLARFPVQGGQRKHGSDRCLVRRPVAVQAQAPFRVGKLAPRMAEYRRPTREKLWGISTAGRQMGRGDGQIPGVSDAATHRWTASDGAELAWHECG